MKFFLANDELNQQAFKEGVVFKRFDLITSEFSGYSFMIIDEIGLTLTTFNLEDSDQFKIDVLVREKSSKSVKELLREEKNKLLPNPLNKQRHQRRGRREKVR